jgi:predicted dehydrogenase/threonine dehydrogenase-like Zn-dependent dehydrogenase
MDQLTQNLKNGAMQLLEVPFPALLPGTILVRNHFSLISAGTEGKTVKDARANYLTKARSRKEEVNKVIRSVKTYGLMPAYRMVMNKLDAPSPLGYSCAGEVIAVASDVTGFKTGDRVACGGATAVHAEVVSVPVNLAVLVPDGISLREACFTTLGAIAMQGIRQADLRLGENAVVIGLGLVGQLTIQLLNAAGIRTVGIDIDQRMVELASVNGAVLALNRNSASLENEINQFTSGFGTDAVIITAGTDSLDPVDLAGELARKKGKVIIVGAVPTGFKRPNYFKKELDLRMSSSYGPGRYDRDYEEEGNDYPYAYVRWTENRNMQAFVQLLADKKISPEKLISHDFDFANAVTAYDLIVEKSQPFTGVVLKYNTGKEIRSSVTVTRINVETGEVVAGFIGAGSFATNFLLPALKGDVKLITVATSRSHTARNIADKFGFGSCTGNPEEVIADKQVNTIFIATRHDTHAEYIRKALEAKKNVFVEKPLCLFEEELDVIAEAYVKSGAQLMLGFNRRFAPLITEIKKHLTGSPVAINYRINAGIVAADHWVHDRKIGGGRILGEACHFIDLCTFLAGSKVKTISAVNLSDTRELNDTVTIQLAFVNGSIATIAYLSNGHKDVPKEYLEVTSAGQMFLLDDFKSLEVFGKKNRKMELRQDKGHEAEVKAFVSSLRNGKAVPISFDEIYHSTLVTFKVLESIATNGAAITL